MRLGILTACWQRPVVTRLVLGYYGTLRVPGLEIVRVAAHSPNDRCDRDPAWEAVEVPNEPVSDKWNAGMAAMRAHRPDAVMVVGSDDLITQGYLADACEEVRGGADLVLLDTLFCLDLVTLRAFRARANGLGAGRTLSRRLLERVGWRPWQTGLMKKLDSSMDRTLRPQRPQRVVLPLTPRHVCVDIKTADNIWSYDAIAARLRPTPVSASGLMHRFFPVQAGALDIPKPLPVMAKKVRMRALTTFVNHAHEGAVRRNRLFETTEARADALEAAGAAVRDVVLPQEPETTKPTGPSRIKSLGGGWYQVGDEKVQGKRAAEALANA